MIPKITLGRILSAMALSVVGLAIGAFFFLLAGGLGLAADRANNPAIILCIILAGLLGGPGPLWFVFVDGDSSISLFVIIPTLEFLWVYFILGHYLDKKQRNLQKNQ